MEPELIFESDYSLLHLNYDASRRENAIVWMIGEYVCQVESESVLKNTKLSRLKTINHFISKKLECKELALPDLGFIPGLSATGIG